MGMRRCCLHFHLHGHNHGSLSSSWSLHKSLIHINQSCNNRSTTLMRILGHQPCIISITSKLTPTSYPNITHNPVPTNLYSIRKDAGALKSGSLMIKCVKVKIKSKTLAIWNSKIEIRPSHPVYLNLANTANHEK